MNKKMALRAFYVSLLMSGGLYAMDAPSADQQRPPTPPVGSPPNAQSSSALQVAARGSRSPSPEAPPAAPLVVRSRSASPSSDSGEGTDVGRQVSAIRPTTFSSGPQCFSSYSSLRNQAGLGGGDVAGQFQARAEQDLRKARSGEKFDGGHFGDSLHAMGALIPHTYNTFVGAKQKKDERGMAKEGATLRQLRNQWETYHVPMAEAMFQALDTDK